MRKLKLYNGHGDTINTFGIRVKKPDVRTGRHKNGEMITYDLSVKEASLHKDYKEQGDGIYWAMGHSAMITSSYTQEQIDEQKRLREEKPIEHGDKVMIDGKVYITKVLGDYSNCAVFEPFLEIK